MDFLGLNTNADPHDIKAGQSVEQVNCGGPIVGKLRTRPGLRFVTFSDGNGSTGADPQVAYPYQSPFGTFIVYQLSNGHIYFGASPS